ncbi:DUF3310 domain-containing protein [Chitinophaga rhizosphaerae]|uniref:DUF3310 domain-containing protein n=1 Tax=Chitinophaga rhizosphaerae TaxID=1864947 RepID=UPI000F809883|nr:DUF3310 domain-containing protein [Chitinophaga rhizosphaerae]
MKIFFKDTGLENLQRAIERAAQRDAQGKQCSPENDFVNRPGHYTAGAIEVIDFIEDQGFNYRIGNAVKYLCRAGRKDPAKHVEDLQKAIWYINREIQTLEKDKP